VVVDFVGRFTSRDRIGMAELNRVAVEFRPLVVAKKFGGSICSTMAWWKPSPSHRDLVVGAEILDGLIWRRG